MIAIKMFLKSWLHIAILMMAICMTFYLSKFPQSSISISYLSRLDTYYQDVSIYKLTLINYIILMFCLGWFMVIKEVISAFRNFNGK